MIEKPPWVSDEMESCRPADSLEELERLVAEPPGWRALCRPLRARAHSSLAVCNRDVSADEPTAERPFTYCHYEEGAERLPRRPRAGLPRTLVCHDMMGGYHDDSIIDGTGKYDAYTFYNWAGVDIFCYFSHHLFTVPPVAWINAAHLHGVKVLGTLITEWTEGMEFWDAVLADDEAAERTTRALVAAAKLFNFDGWLLNVENKVNQPDRLLEFVQRLHRLLHQELDAPELIWYDSVTVEGRLNWQNGLNHKNKAYFDACDGIFTNYSWTPVDVVNSAAEAGARLTDVFVGLDVWGRNFYGGGQLNVRAAAAVVAAHGLSLAVFAPAWTHEALPEPGAPPAVAMAEGLDRYGTFLLRDRALWDSLWPFLNTKLPAELPFQTSFCRGHGLKRRLYGEVMSPLPWFNLRHQQYQPNTAHGPHGYLLSSPRRIEAVVARAQHSSTKVWPDTRQYLYQLVDDEDSEVAEESEEEPCLPVSDEKPPPSRLGSHTADAAAAEPPPDALEVPEPPSPTSSPSVEKKSSKRSLKQIIQSFFFRKKGSEPSSRRNSGRSTPTLAPETAAEAGADVGIAKGARTPPVEEVMIAGFGEERRPSSGSLHGSSGRSMVTMSVNLRLGGSGRGGGGARARLAAAAGERACCEPYWADSFTGGACLALHPGDGGQEAPAHRRARLLLCDFLCRGTLVVVLATKTLLQYPHQSLNLLLCGDEPDGTPFEMTLSGRPLPASRWVSPPLAGAALRRLRRRLLRRHPGFYVPQENAFRWKVHYYEVDMSGRRVLSVNARTVLPQGALLLGHLGLLDPGAEGAESDSDDDEASAPQSS